MAVDTGVGEIVFSLVMGAFCGLILGFIVAHVLRYCSLLVGRNLGGYSWTIYGAIFGAALFVLFSVTDDE